MATDATVRPRRLCVVATHPIQYSAPWFRDLAGLPDCSLHVIYLRSMDSIAQGSGFDRAFQWDLPLLVGYSNEILDIPADHAFVPTALRRLWRAIRRSEASCVLVTGWNEPLLIAAQVVVRLQRRRLLVRGDSNDLRPRSHLVQALQRILHRLPHGFLVVGKSNRRFYQKFGVATRKLFSGAHFVENDRLSAMRSEHLHERHLLRQERGFTSTDFVLLFCGKHVSFKRPAWLLEAAAILRAAGHPVKVLFAGSGQLTPDLHKLASELAVPTHFEGFLNQTELWRAYVTADALVLPSDTGETWGLVANEAMLFKLPIVISAECGCADDLVVEGETGFVFDGGPRAIAEQVEKIVRDRDSARRMGEVGYQRVTSNYSMDVATAGLRNAMAELGG